MNHRPSKLSPKIVYRKIKRLSKRKQIKIYRTIKYRWWLFLSWRTRKDDLFISQGNDKYYVADSYREKNKWGNEEMKKEKGRRSMLDQFFFNRISSRIINLDARAGVVYIRKTPVRTYSLDSSRESSCLSFIACRSVAFFHIFLSRTTDRGKWERTRDEILCVSMANVPEGFSACGI